MGESEEGRRCKGAEAALLSSTVGRRHHSSASRGGARGSSLVGAECGGGGRAPESPRGDDSGGAKVDLSYDIIPISPNSFSKWLF